MTGQTGHDRPRRRERLVRPYLIEVERTLVLCTGGVELGVDEALTGVGRAVVPRFRNGAATHEAVGVDPVERRRQHAAPDLAGRPREVLAEVEALDVVLREIPFSLVDDEAAGMIGSDTESRRIGVPVVLGS